MPKTKLLYLSNSYLQELDTKIRKIDKKGDQYAITLTQTIFYPQGGGQSSDQGEIIGKNGTLKVTHVTYNNGQPLHWGKLTGKLTAKDRVALRLNWDLRLKNMRDHSAGHILDEAVKDLFPEFYGTDGMHGISKQYWVQFNGFIDASLKDHIQAKMNQIIEADFPITSRLVTKANIEAENIHLPFKLPENKPLRLIQIGDYPPVPDGGTQVKSTSEIGAVTLTEIDYDAGTTKIHYHVDTDTQKPELNPTKVKSSDKTPQPATTSLTDFSNQLSTLLIEAEALEPILENRIRILGKKGSLNQLAKVIPNLSYPDRAVAGKKLNEVKKQLTQKFSHTTHFAPRTTSWLDVTAPGDLPAVGHLHLISEAIDDITEIFKEIGFVRRRYPEIETDWYYAEGLNIPKDHPARDDQETFYLEDGHVLTAHTSNGQLHEMEVVKTPPIKMINIGKTYRRQASNTHSPMFHQFEGLLVDHNVAMTHLVGVSNYFAKRYFGSDREIRLRPHHFQFTEPSFEVDINCHICKGRGEVNGKPCKICKSGWLELGGAGMVHPNVLKNGGIDPTKYSGFAFGWGVERVIMMKHQVTDNLRELYTDDLRFLYQS